MIKHATVLGAVLLVGCSSSGTSKKSSSFATGGPSAAILAVAQIPPGHTATGHRYMIASQGHAASSAGARMFQLGGNAVDAATAISFAISVERPQSTGLGGGGFMLLKKPELREPIAFDFREMAPLKAHKNMYLDDFGEIVPNKSLDGIWAVGVPGLVAGVLEVQKKYGKLPLAKVLAPAIELAEGGFPVYPELANALSLREKVLAEYEASRQIFFKDGAPLKKGDLLVQKDLAHTLRLIAEHGAKGFYQGPVAKAIVAENLRLGGPITQQDLNDYKVKKRMPVRGTYKGYTVYSMSPPSSGGVHVIEIMNILEKDNLKQYGPHDPRAINLTAEAMKAAFLDRARYLGDDDFVDVPVDGLTSKKYAAEIRKNLALDRAKEPTEAPPQLDAFSYEHSETTHFSVMDGEGNVVVSTQTINGHFGSGVVVPGTGVVMNNEMDDFAAKEGASNLFGALGGKNNLISPKKRPLSSMSPTIVLKDKFPVMALGTPSGTRILTCVAQTLMNHLEHGLPLYESVASLRYHHQYSPNTLYLEPGPWEAKTRRQLRDMGQNVEEKDLGCRIQAIAYVGGELQGVSDPRGEGEAKGE